MIDCKHKKLSAQACPDCGESMYESLKNLHIQIAELESQLEAIQQMADFADCSIDHILLTMAQALGAEKLAQEGE